MKTKVKIKRYENNNFKYMDDLVLDEYKLDIYLNGEKFIKLLTIPEKLEELSVGYLYTQGIINSKDDIKSIEVDVENHRLDIYLYREFKIHNGDILSDSGDFNINLGKKNRILKPINWKPDFILENMNNLLNGTKLFSDTGNIHTVFLSSEDKFLISAEDIGRFNALDKAIGEAILKNINLSNTIVYTSGRIPSSIAMKVINAGIPVIVSRSAPTSETLKLAKKHNLTVIGFAKRDRMNIYLQEEDNI